MERRSPLALGAPRPLVDHAHGLVHALGGLRRGALRRRCASRPRAGVRSPFGYLRLRRERYGPKALDAWAKRVRATKTWKDVHVFFEHEEAGQGPKLAAKRASLLRT